MDRIAVCPDCRYKFVWDDSETIMSCPKCGSRYRVKPKNNEKPVLMPRSGRGTVDYITIPSDNVIAGRPLMKTYIPKNWEYHCGMLGDRFDLVSNPFVISINFLSPDHKARIMFCGESFYKHIDPSPQSCMLQNRLDDRTVSRSPSFLRLKSYMTASEYCDNLILESGLERLTLTDEKQPDANEMERMNRSVQSFLSKGFLDAKAEWAGRTYSGISQKGYQMKAYAETRIIKLMKISDVQSLQMMPMGSMFGMRMMPQMVTQQIQELFWDTQYEFMLIAAPSVFDSAYAEMQKIMKTIDYLPGMAQAQAAAMSLANNTVMNISNAQMASFERQQKIISETADYTSDIQHQIIQGNSESHNRTANNISEMINEQNSYYGSDGIVFASTKYDNVYQSTRDPDIYAATEGDFFDIGTEFEKLEKTDGNY